MHLVRAPKAAANALPPTPADGVPGFAAPLVAWAQALDAAANRRAAALNRSWAPAVAPPHPAAPVLQRLPPAALAWSPRLKASANVVPVLDASGSWKTWAAERFQANWAAFLSRPDASHDASYASVKAIYDAVARSAYDHAGANA